MSEIKKLPEYEYNKVPLQDYNKGEKETPRHTGYGVRHTQLIIFLFCLTVSFIARAHMGVTVVAMTSPHKNKIKTKCTNPENCTNNQEVSLYNTTMENFNNVTAENKSIEIAVLANSTGNSQITYNWSKPTQEMVLGSFFLGYCIMTFPMGLVTQRWGGKIPLQIALFVNGIISILTPWLTNWNGWKAVCACRIVQGLSQAGLYPSIQTLLANWVPVSERATLSGYLYTGSTIGTVVAFQLSGLLEETKWGWASTFWAIGAMCLVLFIVVTIFGAATPSVHKTISDEEKNFIMGRIDDGSVRKPNTPWKAILTSRHMWGTLATHVGTGTSSVFMFTQVPSYIHYILGINVKSSGLLSSLPYVACFFTSISFGLISDYLTNRKIVSVKNARKCFNSLAVIGISISLICTSFTTSTVVAVSCIVVAVASFSGVHAGWMLNHIDLAPNFSGTLMMMGNTIMNLCSVLLPVLVSYVVIDVTNKIQWRIMFFIIAGLILSTNAIFIALMSAETQPWNDFQENEICVEKVKLEDFKEKQDKH